MKRAPMIVAALASLAVATAPSASQAGTSVGFSLRIGDPYRGAAIHFRSEPDYILVPGTDIYYIDDYYDRDIYRCDGWWYLVDDGYWYRAHTYRGPFIRIDFRAVPRQFIYVPSRYRRNWGDSYYEYRDYYHRNYGDNYYYYRDRSRWRDRDWRDRGDWRDRDTRYRDRVYERRGDRRDRNWDWSREGAQGDQGNRGDRNRGDRNRGDRNRGDRNRGDRNRNRSGEDRQGDDNDD